MKESKEKALKPTCADEKKQEKDVGGSWFDFLRGVNQDLFTASLVLYLVLLILERLRYGFVSFFFNTDIVLVVVVITGAILVITKGLELSDQGLGVKGVSFSGWRMCAIAGISVLCAATVFSIDIGKLTYPLSVVIGLSTVIILMQFGTTDTEEDAVTGHLPTGPGE